MLQAWNKINQTKTGLTKGKEQSPVTVRQGEVESKDTIQKSKQEKKAGT